MEMRKSEQTLFFEFLHTDKGQTADKKKDLIIIIIYVRWPVRTKAIRVRILNDVLFSPQDIYF